MTPKLSQKPIGGFTTKNTTKMIALAVALVVMISAVAVIAMQGPATTGAADIADTPAENDDQTTPVQNDDTTEVPIVNDKMEVPCDDPLPANPTTITAKKTADGFWDQTMTYSWTVDKMFAQDAKTLAVAANGYDIQIEPGESAMISYLIIAERSEPVIDDAFGVYGTITVVNTGCYDTEDLAIYDTVQIPGECGYVNYMTFEVDTSCHPVLKAGECYTYSYAFEFEPACDVALYRNVAEVTISNFFNHVGDNFGVRACDMFELPCEPEISEIDATACLRDEFTVPCGFTVEAMCDIGPWMLGEESYYEFPVNLQVTNVDAARDSIFKVCNKAILTPEDSCKVVSDGVGLAIYSGMLETTLDVCKTAEVSWTESVKLDLSFPEPSAIAEVNVEAPEGADPVQLAQILITDEGAFTVVGTITVTNTGCYPTEGLFVTDTIQMWNGECWIDLASIDVDVSCMPVLCPGASYTYDYEITFMLDNVGLLTFDDLCLTNVAFAGICNYDDDAEGAALSGVAFYLPLDVPVLPELITIETNAAYHEESSFPVNDCTNLVWSTDLTYHQLVQIAFCEEETRMSLVTDIAATSTLKYITGCNEISEDLVTAIHYEGSTMVSGEARCAELSFASMDKDCNVMEICLKGQKVCVDMKALLCASNAVSVYADANGFAINNQQMMFYGAFACFEIPADEMPNEPA
jgi:hypothetical protein